MRDLLRSLVGGAAGAAVAGAALRAKRLADERGVSFMDAVADLPSVLAEDSARVRAAARGALRDGKDAAKEAEVEIDSVLRGGRKRRGEA